MFSDSLYFAELHYSTIIQATFFFKIVSLCNHTLLAVTVKVLETFLEVVLWKPFWLLYHFLDDVSANTKAPSLYHFLDDVSANTKAPSLQCWSFEKTGKNQLQPCQGSMGVTFFDQKSSTKSDWCAGALSWRRNQLLILHFSMHFLMSASLRQCSMPVYISLFICSNSCKLHQQIPVICTSEFQELFDATTFMLSKCAYSLFDIVTYINLQYTSYNTRCVDALFVGFIWK